MTETPTGSPDAPVAEVPNLLDYASEEDLKALAIEFAQAALPEWTPHEGNVEVILIESLAVMVTSLAFALEQAPGALLEQLLQLYGTRRDQGAPAWAVAEITTSGARAVHEIPEGTRMRAHLRQTGESVDFLTSGRLEIVTAESVSGPVQVVADTPGTAFNKIPVGTTLEMVDSLPFVESVRLITASAGGRDEESDMAFQGRAAARLQRLVETLVLPSHFQLAALELPEVGRARVVNLFDPSHDAAPGESVGHVTVAVADHDGRPLTVEQRQMVAHTLQQMALASLVVHVVDPDYQSVDLEIEVLANVEADPAAVRAAVESRVRSWLSPARWDWSQEVRQFAMVSELAQVQGVVQVLSAPQNMTLAGVAPLPEVGELTVIVREVSE